MGDKLLDEPPYYAGRGAVAGTSVAHLPVAYQRGAEQEAIFEPEGGEGTAVSRLLDEMNAYLDSLGVSVLLHGAGELAGTVPPDVRFGCEQTPLGECENESEDIAVQGKPWMRLAVGRPSAGWVAAVRSAAENAGADGVLVITLEVGEYWTHQRNLRGDKEVRLGSGHSARVPWLTSLDQPAQVLQLTGALVDRDGWAVRIGAEGMLARSTPLLASGFGAQALLREEDVERLRTARREDLPGQPLVWKIAIRNLVAGLIPGRELDTG